MAFPTVSDTVITDNSAALVNNHFFDVPSPLEIGDLLVVFCWTTRDGFSHTAMGGWPAGWIQKAEHSHHASLECRAFKFKPPLLPILGVERGDRTFFPIDTVTGLSTPLGQRSYFICFRIAPDDIPSEYVLAAGQGGGGPTPPDPPNLVYSATPKDVLWFTACHPLGPWNFTNGYPAGYTLHQHVVTMTSLGDVGAMAARELNAASEDPDVFTPSSPSDQGGLTVGIAINGPNGPAELSFPSDPSDPDLTETAVLTDEIFIVWDADRGFDDDTADVTDVVTPVES